METLRAGSPLRVGDVTLVPIERARIDSVKGDAGYWIGAFKEAFAVVLYDVSGVRVLSVDSSEIDLDSLIKETPNLGAILTGLSVS